MVATKLYCFVHKVPVCGECICFPEHQICVVLTYSEWVIDGEYDWPPKSCHCQAELAEGTDPQTTRLGCLHVIHTNCLVSHVKSFPQETAPAGYVCPTCSTSIWPPKSVKDSGSCLHSNLKEAIMQTGLMKNVFGNHPVPFHGAESRSPPPAFASEPLMHASSAGDIQYIGGKDVSTNSDILEINGHGSATSSLSNHGPDFINSASPTGVRCFNFSRFHSSLASLWYVSMCWPRVSHTSFFSRSGATMRKSAMQVDRQNPDVPYSADDEVMKMQIGKSTPDEVHFATSSSGRCCLFGLVHCQLYQ